MSETKHSLSEQKEAFLAQQEAFLDQFIHQDDDEKLFISSYIHGHFSLIAASMSGAEYHSDDHALEAYAHAFHHRLSDAVDTAIANNELSSEDANAVVSMLSDMYASFEGDS
ncbi:YfcL family protein [Ningiella sp. W23]|uniref:YfcL family protein n=1 Tax=Ningiella sp. W23 TaxID=3023715 RepID=UPI003756EEF2